MSASPRYVLITAARNEEDCIGRTIEAVLAQTILPQKWVIVDDSSTDRTQEIIERYAREHSLIELVHGRGEHDWSFSSKVAALAVAYDRVRLLDYDFIGNLDADITFGQDYYERVIEKCLHNAKLGIAGGMVGELRNGRFEPPNYNLNSVAGAVQLFPRKCYEDIGGHFPMRLGGEDAVAEVMARMHGWETQSFPEILVNHHRIIGATQQSVLRSRFVYGTRDYLIGNHPVFMMFKCIDRFRENPIFIGGVLMALGYLWGWISRKQRSVPGEVVAFLQKEQKQRMISRVSRSG